MAQLDFTAAPPTAPPASARTRFDAQVEHLLESPLGDNITGEVASELEGLLTLLGALFDVPFTEMAGDPEADSTPDRRGLASMLVACWRPRRHGGRGLRPHAVVHAIRKCTEICQRFPTEGFIAALACGESVASFPGGILLGTEVPKPPPPGPISRYMAQVTETWRSESRALGLDPERLPPREISVRRAAEVAKATGYRVPTQPKE